MKGKRRAEGDIRGRRNEARRAGAEKCMKEDRGKKSEEVRKERNREEVKREKL